MIAMLRGRLAATLAGEVIVDVGGVGYRVLVVPGDIRATVGADVELHTYLVVREDALTLYGFRSAAAVSLFTQLVGVSGVGPKLALAAIGTLGPEGLRRAVVTEDVRSLTTVPGVGRKSAQRLILELRERLGALGTADLPPAVSADNGAQAEVRAALDALGYSGQEIEQALGAVPADGADTGAQLRAALQVLGGRHG